MDERLIAKYEREAKEKNRESWYMAYIMDTNEEERAKGKTVEVGRAHFETVKKRCGWRGGAVSRQGTVDSRCLQVHHFGRARPQKLRAKHDRRRCAGGRGGAGDF